MYAPCQVRQLCGGKLLAIDSALGRWFRSSGNNYCAGAAPAASADGLYTCPRMHAACEGQTVRFERAERAAGEGGGEPSGEPSEWRVQVVESSDGQTAQDEL